MTEKIFLHKYDGKPREIAKAIKDVYNTEALQQVSPEMAKHVEPGSILVPAPSSSGRNPAMLFLAQAIARLVPDARAIEAVERHKPVKSSHEARVMGLDPPTLKEHIKSMHLAQDVGDEGLVYLVDNVVTTGNTLKAVEEVLREPEERMRWLVYADASEGRIEQNIGDALRICISGSRTCFDREIIRDVLLTLPPGITIIHGAAKGVDTIAGELALDMGFDVEEWPAKWKLYGRKAGPIRNKEMIETCDKLIAFWDGKSTGTKNAIDIARAAGLEYEVIPCS